MTPILVRLLKAVVVLLCLSALYWIVFRSRDKKGARETIRLRVRVWAYGLVFSSSAWYFIVGVRALRHSELRPAVSGILAVSAAGFLVELTSGLLFEVLLPARRQVRLPYLIQSLVRGIAYLILAIGFLHQWHVDLSSIVTGSAVFSIVIGLALQDTLGNLFSGVSVDIARPFRLGDWVRVGDREGRVEAFNWRATSLVTREGTQVIVPNRAVSQGTVLNYSWPSARQRLAIPVRVHYRHPPGQVEKALLACACDSPGVCDEPAPEVQVEGFAPDAVNYVLKLHIDDYGRRPFIESEVRRRIWYRFRREGIDIPYAVGDIAFHGNEDGAPALADRVGLLRETGFFAGLSESELNRLAATVAIRLFARDETVFRQGDAGDILYVIRRGRVEVRVGGAGDGDALRATLGPGDFFGEISLMTGAPRSATVLAVADTELLEVEKQDLKPLLEGNPELVAVLSRALAERQQASRTHLAEQAARAQTEQAGDIESTTGQILAAVRRFFSF